MTDFLTCLLQRSRGQATELAPRLPSIFEPAGGEALQSAEEQPVPQPTAAERSPSADLPRPARAGLDDLASPLVRDAVPQNPGRISARSRNNDEIERQPAAQTETLLTEPVDEVERRLAVQTMVLRTEPIASSPGSARRDVIAVSLDEQRRPPPRVVDAETARRRDPGGRPHPVAPSVPPEPVGEDRALGSPRSEDEGPPPLDEPLSPRLGTLSVPPRLGTLTAPPGRSVLPSRLVGDPSPPPEPTVHVTIGRVEIRAVTAPAPPARRPQAARTMSLDEYLTERNRRSQA